VAGQVLFYPSLFRPSFFSFFSPGRRFSIQTPPVRRIPSRGSAVRITPATFFRIFSMPRVFFLSPTLLLHSRLTLSSGVRLGLLQHRVILRSPLSRVKSPTRELPFFPECHQARKTPCRVRLPPVPRFLPFGLADHAVSFFFFFCPRASSLEVSLLEGQLVYSFACWHASNAFRVGSIPLGLHFFKRVSSSLAQDAVTSFSSSA